MYDCTWLSVLVSDLESCCLESLRETTLCQSHSHPKALHSPRRPISPSNYQGHSPYLQLEASFGPPHTAGEASSKTLMIFAFIFVVSHILSSERSFTSYLGDRKLKRPPQVTMRVARNQDGQGDGQDPELVNKNSQACCKSRTCGSLNRSQSGQICKSMPIRGPVEIVSLHMHLPSSASLGTSTELAPCQQWSVAHIRMNTLYSTPLLFDGAPLDEPILIRCT